MKILTSLFLFSAIVHAQPVYIGTSGDGIYLAEFDSEKGILSEPAIAIKYKKPGFLAAHPEKPIIYAVGGDNTVGAFQVARDHSLTLLGSSPCGGKGPCHLAVDASGRTVAVANYGDGSVATVRLDSEGKPGEIVSSVKVEGSGPNLKRQKEAHTHGVYFDNANRFLFAPDLGADRVLVYKFDPATSGITPEGKADLKSQPGSGPRHLAFSPDEKHMYVIDELSNAITVADFDRESGALSEIQIVPTLPEDFEGKNTTAEIEVHPNGNFVYCSNRGHGTIAVFARDPESGELELLQHADCGGKIPRHFKIDPSGKWLLCGHQKSNTVSVLPLDSESGLLGNPQSTVKAPSPICILFQ